MVAGMSRGKKAYVQYERELSDALARLAEMREQFKASIDADAESFNEVMAAFKKTKEHPEAQAEVEAATKKATLIPLVVAERAKRNAPDHRVAAADDESEDGVGLDGRSRHWRTRRSQARWRMSRSTWAILRTRRFWQT